jgi:hypothetical protein
MLPFEGENPHMHFQCRSFASICLDYLSDVVWSLAKQTEALFLASGMSELLLGFLPFRPDLDIDLLSDKLV